MRFFFFHLMPYADLDPDYDKLHKSSWVTLPNDYYDPVRARTSTTATWTSWNTPRNSASRASA
jgi:hypothetical protein